MLHMSKSVMWSIVPAKRGCTERSTVFWLMGGRPLWRTNRRCLTWRLCFMRSFASAILSHLVFSVPPLRMQTSMGTRFPKAPWWSPTCTQCTLMRSTGTIQGFSHHRGFWTAKATLWGARPSCLSLWVSFLMFVLNDISCSKLTWLWPLISQSPVTWYFNLYSFINHILTCSDFYGSQDATLESAYKQILANSENIFNLAAGALQTKQKPSRKIV